MASAKARWTATAGREGDSTVAAPPGKGKTEQPDPGEETPTTATVDQAGSGLIVVAGLDLEPTMVLSVGNPQVGTPLMHCGRTVAIDLPQRILVWTEGDRTRVAYNVPEWLAARHDLEGCEEVLGRVRGALDRLVTTATEEG